MSSWPAVLIACIILLVFALTISCVSYTSYQNNIQGRGGSNSHDLRAQVLVLGDIGRSPRMQNHAVSLVKSAVSVDLIGYLDSDLNPGLMNDDAVTVHAIDKTPKMLQTSNPILFLILGPLKVLHQFWSLLVILGYRTPPAKWLLVQNPPSIPTLFVASAICWLRGTQLIIDWHNFGYSILALRLGRNHPMVHISYAYERWFSRYADFNFTVSDAMKKRLWKDFNIRAPLQRLYDRPSADFYPIAKQEQRRFLASPEFAQQLGGIPLGGNFKVLVSSTSWTPDEDFAILLDALVAYSRIATTSNKKLPELLVVITGKGPQKEAYSRSIKKLAESGKLEKVAIRTAWLPTQGYATLLASADIGISLHQSSSGVDLPMKVVDMFGAGLPVVGWGLFESWSELVKDGVNGRSFGSADELYAILIQLLSDDGKQLQELREGVLQEHNHGWDQEWNATMGQALRVAK